MGKFQGKSLPKNFIDMSEINENFDEENVDVPAEGAVEEAPVDDVPVDGEAAEGAEGTEEGQPEVIKVYTDAEEDIQELIDAGILEEDGTLPEDGLYIKIKTIDGEEVTLLFTEKDPSARTPVTDEDLDGAEGEEVVDDAEAADIIEDEAVTENFGAEGEDIDAEAGTEDLDAAEGEEGVEGEEADTTAPGRYDTELCAQHNDHEYCVAAEIEISETGEIEDVDPKEDEETGEPEIQAEEATEDEGAEFSEGMPEEKEEDVVTESKIWDFSTFLKNRK